MLSTHPGYGNRDRPGGRRIPAANATCARASGVSRNLSSRADRPCLVLTPFRNVDGRAEEVCMKLWQVDDVMTRDVVSVRKDTPYRDVVELLIECRISAVPVVDKSDQAVGVVSEADLLLKVAAVDAPRSSPLDVWRHRGDRVKAHGRTAGDVMSAPAVTTLPSLAVSAAARKMYQAQVKRLPVVTEQGRLIGIVTRSDLLRVHLRSDANIRHEVFEEVFRGVLADDAGSLRVETRAGVVTLSGRTHLRSTAAKAVVVAEHTRGVVDVVDDIAFDLDDLQVVGTEVGTPFGVG
jgi:CBS domain-containing protein